MRSRVLLPILCPPLVRKPTECRPSAKMLNRGLFEIDPEVDDLQLDDKWTLFFKNIGLSDFRDEISVEVLGHLFERSVKDVERIRVGGLLGGESGEKEPRKMDKSAERKRGGIYYTPSEFTSLIVRRTIGAMIEERFASIAREFNIDAKKTEYGEPDPKAAQYYQEYVKVLRRIKIVDPACGSGAFLVKAYTFLEDQYKHVIGYLIHHDGKKHEKLFEQIPDFILNDNLYGVDLSEEAVEITRLSLWIQTARPGKPLNNLSKNVIAGNSLVSDSAVHPLAMKWDEKFHDVFSRPEGGFDCVIGNPPWERMKLQEREFFDSSRPDIASSVDAATRRDMIEKLKRDDSELYERYSDTKDKAEQTLDHVRTSGRFPLTGKGDINTYAVFAELAHTIVASKSRVGLLVPSGIATDDTTKDFLGN